MKLLIDVRTLGSRPSGVGYYAYNFIKGLSRFEDIEMILVTDVAWSNEIKELQGMDIKVVEYGKEIKKSFKVFEYFNFIQEEVRKHQPDFFWEINNLIPRRIKCSKCKSIVTIHDVFPLYQKESYGLVYRLYFRFFMKKTLRYSDLIFYNSKSSKTNCEKYFPKAGQVKNYISYIIFDQEVNSSQISDENYFLYIGNLEYRKGVDILIRGYQKYCNLGGTKKLKLAGKIRDDAIREILEKHLAGNERIEYLGYVDDETRSKLYRECSCLVFPSRAEGFGMPVIEATLSRKPVILSNLDVFEEIMADHAYYFELSDNEQDNIDELAKTMLEEKFELKIDDPAEYFGKFSSENLTENIYAILKENCNG